MKDTVTRLRADSKAGMDIRSQELEKEKRDLKQVVGLIRVFPAASCSSLLRPILTAVLH
jgi:hypothetical protein